MPYLLFIFLMIASASSLSGQVPLPLEQADSLFQKGIVEQKKRAFLSSNQYFKQASILLKNASQWNKYLEAQNQIARNYWKMEKLDSSSVICQSISNSPYLETGSLIEGDLFNNIGVIHDIRAEYKKALEYFHKALSIRKKKLGDDHIETGKLYYNIGACYELQNQYNTSLEYRKKALRNFKKNLPPNHPFFLAVYRGMMNTYFSLEKYEEVVFYIEIALSIAKTQYPSTHPEIGYLYGQLGIAKTKIDGSKKEGLQLVKKGFEIAKKYYGENHPELIWQYSNIAGIYADNDNYEEAIAHQLKARLITIKNYGTKNNNYVKASNFLSSYYQRLQQDSLAFYHAHQSILANLPSVSDSILVDSIPDFSKLPISNIITLSSSLGNMIHFLSQNAGKDEKYATYYYHYLLASDAIFDKAQKEISNTQDKAVILEYLHRFTAKKIQYYKSPILNKEQKGVFIQNAIQQMDRSKSLLLKLSLATDKARQFGGIPDSIQTKEIQIRKKIAQLNKEIWKNQSKGKSISELEEKLFQSQETYKHLNQVLESDYKKYYQLKYQDDKIDIQSVQKDILTPNSLLIQYMQNKDFIYIATISPTDLKLDYFKKDEEYAQHLKNFRKNLSDLSYVQSQKDYGAMAFTESAHFLYRTLLQKHIDNPEIKELIIIADGELNRIPFEALVYKSANQKATFKTLDYLSNKYTIRYAYSAKLLLDAKQNRTNAATDILAFAASYNPSTTNNPVRKELVALEGVQQEVKTLQENFRGEFYLAENATESMIKNIDFNQFGILHLAMHGLLNKENPMQSAMAFTEDTSSQEDGFLYAHEITNMSINTNLVVLSACETGDGKHQKIEGIMSLGRSFMYAGTPSIIMSLWQVSDFSTAQIMQKFYQNLAESQRKSEALRNAKFHYLELVKDNKDLFSHPFFWGAFVNLGDDSVIQLNKHPNYMAWLLGTLGGCVILIGWIYLSRKKRTIQHA